MEPPLSQWELKVLSIMGDGFGKRQTETRVPAFSETNEPIPSSSSQSQPPSFSLPEEIVENVGPSQESQPRQPASQSPPVSQEPVTFRHSSQPARRRTRSSGTGDVRAKLFHFEEQRAERETVRNTELAGINTELAGIRVALSQLCGLMRIFRP